jgi:site-specific DNA recombinase
MPMKVAMKVALYARVSTKHQEKQGTIASQVEALRGYVKKHAYEVVEEYVCADEGYSGALLARPALDRLRDGARAGAFDGVVVLCPDRLSRKYAYLILILSIFPQRHSVASNNLKQEIKQNK